MPPEPILKPIGESLFVVWPDRAVLEFSRVSEHSDSLSAEVSIVSTTAGELSWSRLNLASAPARAGLAKLLEEREPTEDWRHLLDRSCRLVARHVRMGEPAVALAPAAPSPSRWLVDGLIPAGQLTVLCGDGGAGKSLLALTLTVAGLVGRSPSARWAVAPVTRAMYLDWESDRQEQATRLWALTQGLGSEPVDGALLHRTMRRPLRDEIAAIRCEVARHAVDFMVCDSLGPACGPEPETADAAVTTLLALRSLAVTVLIIAHVSKASAEAKAPARPFGSVYVQNLARSVIEARRSEALDATASAFVLTLYHRKSNHGRTLPPSALRFTFTASGALTVSRGEADPTGTSLAFQILQALHAGGQKPGHLAEQLDTSSDTVRRTLLRLEKQDMVMRIPGQDAGGRGKEQMWGLVTNRDNTGTIPGHSANPAMSPHDTTPCR